MKQTMNSNSNRNCILMYAITAVILIFITVSASAASDSTKVNAIEPDSSASRDIENQNLAAGGSTNVTVTINNVSQVLLVERLPFGWGLVRIYDDATNFRNSANEWVWIYDGTKTVTYRVAVPSDAIPGTYNLNGNISNLSGIIAGVAGENTIIISDANGRSGGGSGIGGPLQIVHSESTSENEAQAAEDNQDVTDDKDAVAADADRVVSEELTKTDQDSEAETGFKTQEPTLALFKTIGLGLVFVALLGIVAIIMRSKGWKLR